MTKAERITKRNRHPQRPAHLIVSPNKRKVKLGYITESLQDGYHLLDSGKLMSSCFRGKVDYNKLVY